MCILIFCVVPLASLRLSGFYRYKDSRLYRKEQKSSHLLAVGTGNLCATDSAGPLHEVCNQPFQREQSGEICKSHRTMAYPFCANIHKINKKNSQNLRILKNGITFEGKSFNPMDAVNNKK